MLLFFWPAQRTRTIAKSSEKVQRNVKFLYRHNTLLSFRNTTVIVELENVNDNTPSFTQEKFFFTAREVRRKSYINSCMNSPTIIVQRENLSCLPVNFSFYRQGSYVGNSKVVGRVTAIDRDQDEQNSVYGQIKYEFVNQTSECI